MLLAQVTFDDEQQCFITTEGETTDGLLSGMTIPLSATFQLTRNCNFKCVYCSEPPGIRTRPLEEVLAMIDKLAGMRRIIFSGGEPMASSTRTLPPGCGTGSRTSKTTSTSTSNGLWSWSDRETAPGAHRPAQAAALAARYRGSEDAKGCNRTRHPTT